MNRFQNEQLTEELRQFEDDPPATITRRHIVIGGAFLGVVAAVLVAAVVGLGLALKNEIESNRSNINRIEKLEQPPPPTAEQIIRRAKLAIENCAADPDCSKLFSEAGRTGAAGKVGIAGAPGANGATGSMGRKGSAGPRGPKGATGQRGPVGPAGPKGEPGERGVPGPLPDLSGFERRIGALESRLNKVDCSLRSLLKIPCP